MLAVIEPGGSKRNDPRCELWTVKADGTDAHVVGDGSGRSVGCEGEGVAWSPDGRDLAYEDSGGLYRVRATGGHPELLAPLGLNVATLSWSPTAATIVASGIITGAVESVPARGGKPKTLFDRTCRDSGAFFSPDGSRIAAVVPAAVGCQLETVASDGTRPSPVMTMTLASSALTGWVRQPANQRADLIMASSGYDEVTADGQVADFGGGFPSSDPLAGQHTPIIGGAAALVPDPHFPGATMSALTLVATDGTVYGPMGLIEGHASQSHVTNSGVIAVGPPSAPIIAAGPPIVASDGSSYSDDKNLGATQPIDPSRRPIVGIASVDSGEFVDANGHVYGGLLGVDARGNVTELGVGNSANVPSPFSAPPPLGPVAAIAVDAATGGYWLVTADGQVSGYGAPVDGSLPGQRLSSPIVAMAADNTTGGYWLVAQDGTVYGFDAPVRGSTASMHPAAPTVAISTQPPTQIGPTFP